MTWDITKKEVPRCYGLSSNEKIPAIIIKIHESCVGDEFREENILYRAFKKLGEKNGFWYYEIEIPTPNRVYWTVARLIELTAYLDHLKKENASTRLKQLITFKIEREKQKYELSGQISPSLRGWLKKKMYILEVFEAMKTAYQKMLGSNKFTESEFMVSIRGDGTFVLKCPDGILESDGYNFSSGNNKQITIITFITGLAAILDIFRKEN